MQYSTRILKEHERTKANVPPRPFKFVKNLCAAHNISGKELARYYRKWNEGGRLPEALLPEKRGAGPGSRWTPKEIERSIIEAYRKFGSNQRTYALLLRPRNAAPRPFATIVRGLLTPR